MILVFYTQTQWVAYMYNIKVWVTIFLVIYIYSTSLKFSVCGRFIVCDPMPPLALYIRQVAPEAPSYYCSYILLWQLDYTIILYSS